MYSLFLLNKTKKSKTPPTPPIPLHIPLNTDQHIWFTNPFKQKLQATTPGTKPTSTDLLKVLKPFSIMLAFTFALISISRQLDPSYNLHSTKPNFQNITIIWWNNLNHFYQFRQQVRGLIKIFRPSQNMNNNIVILNSGSKT